MTWHDDVAGHRRTRSMTSSECFLTRPMQRRLMTNSLRLCLHGPFDDDDDAVPTAGPAMRVRQAQAPHQHGRPSGRLSLPLGLMASTGAVHTRHLYMTRVRSLDGRSRSCRAQGCMPPTPPPLPLPPLPPPEQQQQPPRGRKRRVRTRARRRSRPPSRAPRCCAPARSTRARARDDRPPLRRASCRGRSCSKRALRGRRASRERGKRRTRRSARPERPSSGRLGGESSVD